MDELPRPPIKASEVQRWIDAYDELLRRVLVLEEIADRLAATAADPQAVADYWVWKEGGAPRPLRGGA